jgi:hypothetical protein
MRANVNLIAIAILLTGSLTAHAEQAAGSPGSSPPLSVSDIEHGLKAGVTNTRMAELVKQYGVDFELTDATKKQLHSAGATDELLLRIAGSGHPSPPSAASPARQQTLLSSDASVVLVDTDDTCHLVLDDQDEGTISPSQSRKLSTTPGEHIVKCTVENMPDLLSRQVVQVKPGSQSVVAISLKDLHNQKQQALSQEEKQKAEKLAAAEEERTQAEQQPVFTAKMFDIVKGTWTGAVTGYGPVAIQATFSHLDNGEIKVALQTVAKLSSCNPCGEVWEVALRASSASILVNDGAQRCVSYETKGKSDTKGWQQCPYGSTSDAVVISVAGNQLQVKWGHDPRRATWGLWQGDTFVLSRSGN